MILALADKVAVVSGGASGIGEACVEFLAASGATAYVVDLGGDRPIDVTDRGQLDALAADIEAERGGLDILVNAAGILTENRPFDQQPAEDFRRNLEVNLLGTVNTCQAFAELLKARRGAVVNISSQAGLVSLPMQAAYSASKGGVIALTRSLAIDWAEEGVRANCVCPGFVRTAMTKEFFENETFVAAAKKRIPIGRIFDPSEVASVVCFLASPLAAGLTGTTLPIDGGWTAGEPALPW
ncbi:MAG: SDR family NAD(P)-dependent oxidoreductase [Actinomycetia bacterium]|nr:SDR family NAD(P)-dependent oxidoreductase [Actinomycetes bacterium]